MVAVALLLVALTGVFLLSEGGQEEEPVFADIQVETTAEEFVVKHGGGDTVAPADLTLTTTGAAEGTVALDRFTATSNSFTAAEEIETPTDEFDGVADNEWLLGEFGVAVTHEPTNSVFASNRGAVAIERLSVDAGTADDDVSVLAGNREGASASTVSLAVTASTNGPTTGVITHMLDRDNIDVSPSDRLQALDFAESEREVTVDIENSVSITVNFNGVSTGADLLTGEWAELALDVPETLEFGAQESGEYAVEATYDLYDSETVTGAASVAAANSSVVEIDGTNIVAVGSGTTEVTATYTDDEAGRLQTTETVTVEDPVESVSLDTGSGGLEFGDRETTDYEVTATFASGRTVDVTDEASVTSNAGVVTVDETANTLQAVEAGEATLTATYNEVSDETSLGVTDPLADINLTVPTPLEVSETAGYEVNATFESGRTEDITDEASVTSDNGSVVTVDEQAAEIEAIGEGIATLTAGYQSVENSSEVSVTDETEGGLPPTEEIPVSSDKDSPNRSQYDALEEIELPDPFTLVLEVEQNGEPFTGEITKNEEFIWIEDHLGEFDETPADRYGGYTDLNFNQSGMVGVVMGNGDSVDVHYEGIDVNEITETITVDFGAAGIESDLEIVGMEVETTSD
jgi:hypothetical protein